MSTDGCIGICCITSFPPTPLFRDQREAKRADIHFVEMRGEKREKEGDMF